MKAKYLESGQAAWFIQLLNNFGYGVGDTMFK